MTLLGLSSSLDKNDSAWAVIVLDKNDSACHRPWTKMTLLGLSSPLDKNDFAWVVIVPGQK